MAGQMVEFASNGGTDQGYLATPASGSGPGVLVIQEYWGLLPHIKDVCDRFAAAGFVALAPDLYHGAETREPDEADKLMMALNIAQAAKDLRGAAAYLKPLPAVTSQRLGVVGFCMGGQLALYAASVAPEIGPVVDFYGGHPNVTVDYSKLTGPVLGNFGGQDDFMTPEAVRQLDADLTAHGISHDFKTYPDAGHAFFNDSRANEPDPPYRAGDARDAWDRTIAFFRQHLT